MIYASLSVNAWRKMASSTACRASAAIRDGADNRADGSDEARGHLAAATAIAGHILPAPSVRVRTPQIIALADSTDDAEFLPADIILANQRSARHTARELAAAVSREDYASAAKLKEELALLHAADPIHTLRAELADALSREEYDAAASTQQQLARLRETRPGILWRDEVLVLGAEGKSLHLHCPATAAAAAASCTRPPLARRSSSRCGRPMPSRLPCPRSSRAAARAC